MDSKLTVVFLIIIIFMSFAIIMKESEIADYKTTIKKLESEKADYKEAFDTMTQIFYESHGWEVNHE